MTERDWLWVEQRAAEIVFGEFSAGNTPDERVGWSIHCLNSHRGTMTDPSGREQWAGWLAREIWNEDDLDGALT